VVAAGGGHRQCLETAGATVERVAWPSTATGSTEHLMAGGGSWCWPPTTTPATWTGPCGAARLRPDLPLVARVFDESLARYLAQVERLTVLSMSQVAAPVFAEAACARSTLGQRARPGQGAGGGRGLAAGSGVLGALAGLGLVVVPATFFFARVLKLRIVDALYFVWTTVMTVGYGDISLRDTSDGAKVVGMLLMLAGAAFVATLFAFLTGGWCTRRLDVLHGRVRVRGRAHGDRRAGNLGFRVANLLAAQGTAGGGHRAQPGRAATCRPAPAGTT
jgi:hypothetical protein